MDNSRTGRPKLTREEKESGLANAKALAREVRGASGLSVAQLLAKMNDYGVMSGTAESLWRKYEAGIAAMSPDRLHNIAVFAWTHGWAGESAKQILHLAGHAKHAEHWITEEKRTRVLQEKMQSIFEELLPGEVDAEAIQMLDMLILNARNAAIDRARLAVLEWDGLDDLISLNAMLDASAARLAEEPKDRYTLQVAVSGERQTVAAWKKLPVLRPVYAIETKDKKGNYVLLYGIFGTAREALDAKSELPAEIRDSAAPESMAEIRKNATEREESIFIPATPGAKGGFGNSIRKPKWLKGKKIDH